MRLLTILFLLVSCPIMAHEIVWNHSGENVTHFNIWTNTDADNFIKLAATVDAETRSYELVLDEDCSRTFVLLDACNNDVCSGPSAMRSFNIICPIPSKTVWGSNANQLF